MVLSSNKTCSKNGKAGNFNIGRVNNSGGGSTNTIKEVTITAAVNTKELLDADLKNRWMTQTQH